MKQRLQPGSSIWECREPLAKFPYRQSSFIVIPVCFKPESGFFKGFWPSASAWVTVLLSFARGSRNRGIMNMPPESSLNLQDVYEYIT
jgi:hypothetical protein